MAPATVTERKAPPYNGDVLLIYCLRGFPRNVPFSVPSDFSFCFSLYKGLCALGCAF